MQPGRLAPVEADPSRRVTPATIGAPTRDWPNIAPLRSGRAERRFALLHAAPPRPRTRHPRSRFCELIRACDVARRLPAGCCGAGSPAGRNRPPGKTLHRINSAQTCCNARTAVVIVPAGSASRRNDPPPGARNLSPQLTSIDALRAPYWHAMFGIPAMRCCRDFSRRPANRLPQAGFSAGQDFCAATRRRPQAPSFSPAPTSAATKNKTGRDKFKG